MKKCPYCAEEIQEDAIICKYCKSSLNEEKQKTYVPQPPLSFNEAVGTCFRKYFDFTGRARGSEFWYFSLFLVIIDIVAMILDINLFGYSYGGYGTLSFIVTAGTLIPQISAAARRLHDSNKSGWRQLWVFTGIGAFFVLYWLIIKGDADKNSYDLNQ